MKWYADYLSIYDKPFTQAPQAVINQVKDKIRQLATHAPLVSVVAIAHNEEKRILSCLWSLCENQHNYPVEILVINNHSTDHTEEVLINPEKPDVPLNKNDAFQKVQKRHVQEKR